MGDVTNHQPEEEKVGRRRKRTHENDPSPYANDSVKGRSSIIKPGKTRN